MSSVDRLLAVGRYLGPFPDRRHESLSGSRVVQLGFDLVPVRVELLQVWQAARQVLGSAGGVGASRAEIVERVRSAEVGWRRLAFGCAARLGDRELGAVVDELVGLGLLVAVPSGEEELGGVLRRFRLVGLSRAKVQGRDGQGRLGLEKGQWLAAGLAQVWSWCSVHADLAETAGLVARQRAAGGSVLGGAELARVTLGVAGQLAGSGSAFFDRADAGVDRLTGSGMHGSVDMPFGLEPNEGKFRWWGLAARRSYGRTFAVGQFVGEQPVRSGEYFPRYWVRLGRGLVEITEDHWWSWSRVFGTGGNFGGMDLTEIPGRATEGYGFAAGAAAQWLVEQPMLLGIGGTDEQMIAQASMVRAMPTVEAADVIEDDGTARPYVSPIGFNGLAFEIGAFGHLEQSLWASLQGVAAQRAAEGREGHEGGTDPLELLRYLMMNPEPLVKRAGYLDIATDPRPPGA